MLTEGKNKMKKNESGRSMVEMLGVLAIIGVLSIGGIAGYTLAMNRYRANEILDTAAKVAVIAMSKNGGQGNTADLGDLDMNRVAGATAISSAANGEVTITFDAGTSEKVRELVNDISGGKLTSDNKIKF